MDWTERIVPLDPDVDELMDGVVEPVPVVLPREQLDLLHDVDAPPGGQIRRIQVPDRGVHRLPVRSPRLLRVVDGPDTSDSMVP